MSRGVRGIGFEPLEARALLDAGSAAAGYGVLPLAFEPNRGQAGPSAQFVAHGQGYAVALDAAGAVLGLGPASSGATGTVTLGLLGSDPAAGPTAGGLLPGISNYITGSDPSRWITDVPNYSQVTYRGVYPGIDLVYYGQQSQLEYDFVVAPGADPGRIALRVSGADSVTLDSGGDLVIQTAAGPLVEHAPAIFQESGGGRTTVPGSFVLGPDGRVGFAVGAYDASRPLVIDPVLAYSTFLSGPSGSSQITSVAVDSAGDAFLTGTAGPDFPTTPGAFRTSSGGAFVAKLNPTGTALIYSTFLGPGVGNKIKVDAAGDAFVVGTTSSAAFPTTASAYQPVKLGTAQAAFVTELAPAGDRLVYSTFLGGTTGNGGQGTQGNGIAVGANGDTYVIGSTSDTAFPTTSNALQKTYKGTSVGSNAFVAVLDATGSQLLYSTYLGGSGGGGTLGDVGRGISVGATGRAYVTGLTYSADFPTSSNAFQQRKLGRSAAFVTVLNPFAPAPTSPSRAGAPSPSLSFLDWYSSYYGGSGTSTYPDEGDDIWVYDDEDQDGDSDGDGDGDVSVFVAGSSSSSDFPTTAGTVGQSGGGAQDVYVMSLDLSQATPGAQLRYSTRLGLDGFQQEKSMAVDAFGDVYVTGTTSSAHFPVTPGAVQATHVGTSANVFVSKLDPFGRRLLYSTFFGNGYSVPSGLALDPQGNAYVVGTASSALQTTPGALQTTTPSGTFPGFVAKFAIGGPPPRQPLGDYYGTHQTDPGIFDATTSTLYVAPPTGSSNLRPQIQQFGDPSHSNVAVFGDYYGTGVTDLGIFDQTTSTLYVVPPPGSTGLAPLIQQFGDPSHRNFPVSGHYYGGLATNLGIFDATTSTLYVVPTSAEAAAGARPLIQQFGDPSHRNIPVSGNYFGGNVTNLGIFDATTSTLYVVPTEDQAARGARPLIQQFGDPSHRNIPVTGDYYGLGQTDLGIFDATTSTLIVVPPAGHPGLGPLIQQFGDPSHANYPVAGDYYGTGQTDLGVFDATTATLYVVPPPGTTGLQPIILQFGDPSHQNSPVTFPLPISLVRTSEVVAPPAATAQPAAVALVLDAPSGPAVGSPKAVSPAPRVRTVNLDRLRAGDLGTG